MDNVSQQSMSNQPGGNDTRKPKSMGTKRAKANKLGTSRSRNRELSELLARSLAFNIVAVEKNCGSEIAENILRVVSDENFDPIVLRSTASSIKDCVSVMEKEIKSDK